MIYEILDDKGAVVNRIIADLDFVEAKYKGLYRDVTPPPVAVEVVAPVKTIEEKVDELSAKIDALTETIAAKG